jgi:hypothetical protein
VPPDAVRYVSLSARKMDSEHAGSGAAIRLVRKEGCDHRKPIWTTAGLEQALGGRLDWDSMPPRLTSYCQISAYVHKVDPVSVLGFVIAAAASRMGPKCRVKCRSETVRRCACDSWEVCSCCLALQLKCFEFGFTSQNDVVANIVTVAPSGAGKSKVANRIRDYLFGLADGDRTRLGGEFMPVFTVGTVPGIVQVVGKNKGMAILMPDEYFCGFGVHQLAPSSSSDRQRLTSLLNGNAAHVGAYSSKAKEDDVVTTRACVCSASTTQPVAYQINVLNSPATNEDGFLHRMVFLPCVAMEVSSYCGGEGYAASDLASDLVRLWSVSRPVDHDEP